METKYFRIILFPLITVLLTVSCIKDDYAVNEVDADGNVRIVLHTNTTEYSRPVSRADENSMSGSPMVFVFTGSDDNALFSQAALSETEDGKTFVTLSQTAKESMIVLIDNVPGGKFHNGQSVAGFNVENINTALTGKTISEVVSEGLLNTEPLGELETRPFPNATDPLPMSGIEYKPGGIKPGTTIGESGKPVKLLRSVAKASVTVDSLFVKDGFRLKGAALMNAPCNGSLFRLPSQDIIHNPANLTDYLGKNTGTEITDISTADADGKTTSGSPLYIYEAGAEAKTALIIESEYNDVTYYYKMAFAHGGKKLDIKRNKNYLFTISGAGTGYTTLQEALSSPASNIYYEITITDAYGHDIVSNGEYYLGLSNSHVIIYEADSIEVTVKDAFTITTNATPEMGVTNARIEWENLEYNGSNDPTSITLAAYEGDVGVTQIEEVVLPANGVGKAHITVGKLTKTVTFTRKGKLSAVGFDELDGNDFVNCEIVSTGENDWLAVSADGATYSKDHLTLTKPGNLYIMAEANIKYEDDPDEEKTPRHGGEMFITRGGKSETPGRTKVIVSQDVVIYKPDELPDVPASGIFYVGAFWRNDQTGERLIRIPYNNDTKGKWAAAVIEGKEWIKLDMLPTNDPGVTWTSDENPADMYDYDKYYQVTGDAYSVGGNMDDENEYIYFRIGLKSTHTGAPRYGAVMISYQDGTRFSTIYIRQGEEADYLMRPEDPVLKDDKKYYPGLRDGLAVKISPYNLTAPEFLDGYPPIDDGGPNAGTSISDHPKLDKKGGCFTKYPSQAGAFFQWAHRIESNSRYAYHPWKPKNNNIVNWGTNTAWNKETWQNYAEMNETCPDGYRRPKLMAPDLVASLNGLKPDESEILNTLWVNPYRAKKDPEETGVVENNFLWGYCADGFFDRRELHTSGYVGDIAVASRGKSTVAYKGSLYFNPFNYASVFIPSSGYRTSSGALTREGDYAGVWTTTLYSWGTSYYMIWYISVGKLRYPNQDFIYNSMASNGWPKEGMTIRCVKE